MAHRLLRRVLAHDSLVLREAVLHLTYHQPLHRGTDQRNVDLYEERVIQKRAVTVGLDADRTCYLGAFAVWTTMHPGCGTCFQVPGVRRDRRFGLAAVDAGEPARVPRRVHVIDEARGVAGPFVDPHVDRTLHPVSRDVVNRTGQRLEELLGRRRYTDRTFRARSPSSFSLEAA